MNRSVGDIVSSVIDREFCHECIRVGIVIETEIKLGGWDVVPCGIRVYWSSSEIENLYQDEVEVIGD